jgi:two-component system, LytTR family, sensor histidine kinase AlgZ
MHPVIIHKKILFAYLFVWVIVGILFASLIAAPGAATWLYTVLYTTPLFLLYGSICLSAWYLCKFFPLKKTGVAKLFVVFGVAALVNSSLWLLIGSEWALLLDRLIAPSGDKTFAVIESRLYFIVGFTLYLLSGAVHYLIILYEESRATQRRLLELNMLAREAELKALRSQINPHFLFNSLNSISALTSSDPKAARRMTELLAEFFRKSIDAGKKEFVALREELELTTHYLDIERIRFGQRLKVDIQIEDGCAERTVPPLILQPIVENAVKHGIAHIIEGGTIRIKAQCGKKSLIISVENPCDPDRPKGKGNQLGLENIRNRLAVVYSSASDVIVRDDNSMFRVDLMIETRQP